MQILDQVRQGIDFIERNLHEEVDLRAVSRAAGKGRWSARSRWGNGAYGRIPPRS